MKADLPLREPKFLERWDNEGIYEKIIERRASESAPRFILHDGPPFANGDGHIGHLLNMTLKDLVLKSRNMMGFSAPFVPGWDCHGLPIEHKVMQDKSKGGEDLTDPVAIREACEATARKFIAIQRGQFKRLGVFGEWETPYLTMDPAYEAEILRTFAKLVDKDLVYNDLRPVRWSTGCQTALAEAELEYDESRVDPSAFVKFPITDAASRLKLEALAGKPLATDASLFALIWTTTPWTLPANLAIALSPHLDYALFDGGEGTGVFLCAVDLAPKLPLADDRKVQLHGSTFKGSAFAPTVGVTTTSEGRKAAEFFAQHPFLDRASHFYAAEFVTAETGTGLVHIAPGHGQDDYNLGKAVGLRLLSPVDDRGCLSAECGVPELVGQYVFKANGPILEMLESKGLLLAKKDYPHKYPLCWRSKTPIIFRAVKQWFIKMDFRADALKAIGEVKWVPNWGENRIRGAVETRPDWCISRQRTWGVPIPVFYGEGGQPLMSGASIRAFADIVEREGTGVWFSTPDDVMAKRLGVYGAGRKGRDTLDVWIDSGSSHAAVLRKRGWWPADMYLEGSDQHRGWFQSSLSLSVASLAGDKDNPSGTPYKQVLTHGFVVNEEGRKYSKKDGALDILSLVKANGADMLRLWAAMQDYRQDIPMSKELMARAVDTYRAIRNTVRVLLGNLHDFDPAVHTQAQSAWSELDLYVYTRLQEVVRTSRAAYEAYEFHLAVQAVTRFCNVELSALYVDVLKDSLYCDAADDPARRSAQTVMRLIASTLARLLAPATPFTAEEIWDELNRHDAQSESIHLQLFPKADEAALSSAPALLERWTGLLALRSRVNEQLEGARRRKEIGKSLEARVEALPALGVQPDDVPLLRTLCMVSQFDIVDARDVTPSETAEAGAEIFVRRARGTRCIRCWKYDEATGADAEHPELCPRCTRVVTSLPAASVTAG